MSPRPITYTYRPGISQDMVDAIAEIEAAVSAATPDTLVKRGSAGEVAVAALAAASFRNTLSVDSTIVGNQNNWDPGVGFPAAGRVRMLGGGGVNIHGLVATGVSDGDIKFIVNAAGAAISLLAQSGSADEANRFAGVATTNLNVGEGALIIRDGTLNRWVWLARHV